MTDFEPLLASLCFAGPLPTGDGAEPLGAAWLPGEQRGIDLAAAGYREEEYILSGRADAWTWDERLSPVSLGAGEFTTRVLVRRPADPSRFSGGVQLEPHHPEGDRALSWAALAPWIVRGGHAHVGFTHEPSTVPELIAWDRARYGALAIEHRTHRFDIAALVAAAIRTGRLPAFTDLEVARIVMSGWSMTGTFCRTFLGEGFHERASLGGARAIDGYVICISSGGALLPGYFQLREGTLLPAGDRRRRIEARGVPVVELLSEGEAETHRAVLRGDADGPHDRYRLYEVAGTGHIMEGDRALATNGHQRARRGFPPAPCEVLEELSDGRMDLVARAVFEAVDRWIAEGVPPPRAGRFEFDDPAGDGIRGLLDEALPLARDGDGNVAGGVRTPWVEAPAARYVPHSTPVPDRCIPFARLARVDPRYRADLIAHMRRFPVAELIARYGDRDGYLDRFRRAGEQLAGEGWLLREDLPELISQREAACVEF